MTAVFFDEDCVKHRTPPGHPERPERLERAWKSLDETGVLKHCDHHRPAPIALETVSALHDAAVAKRIEALVKQGGGTLDADTFVCPASLTAALKAAGAGCEAVDAIIGGKHSNAFCLVRPPGHHATPTRSMGFCLFNNVALAAKHALTKHKLNRVLIVDWDVHHGNGTQDVFYGDDQVTFFSVHRYPFYPGSGRADETGSGKGLGHTYNLPLPYGTRPEDFRRRFRSTLIDAARKSKPELVLLSAGFDAHRDDPIGDLGLGDEDFLLLLDDVRAVADSYCGGNLVSLLEGGYDLDALSRCVTEHVKALADHGGKERSPAARG
jgi:acetoin utilization deacetylase AcuC-like enzyme